MSSRGAPTFFARISKQAVYVWRCDKSINPKDLFRFAQGAPHLILSTLSFELHSAPAFVCVGLFANAAARVPCVFACILTEGSTVGLVLQSDSGHSQPFGHKATLRESRFPGRGGGMFPFNTVWPPFQVTVRTSFAVLPYTSEEYY